MFSPDPNIFRFRLIDESASKIVYELDRKILLKLNSAGQTSMNRCYFSRCTLKKIDLCENGDQPGHELSSQKTSIYHSAVARIHGDAIRKRSSDQA
jgi:hypothetical protein